MLRLKQVIENTDIITQAELARVAGCSPSLLCRILNHAGFPVSGSLREQIKRNISDYLTKRKIPVRGIWQKVNKKGVPRKRAPKQKPMEVIEMLKMLPQKAVDHFNFKFDPICQEIHEIDDVFQWEEFEKTEESITTGLLRQRFFFLKGESGSGKSVLARKIIEQLKHSKEIKIVNTESTASEKVNASSILDGIIYALRGLDKPTKRSLEAKARLARKILMEDSSNKKIILLIEEAHTLHPSTLRFLRRLHESFMDGFKYLLGIFLIGQEGIETNIKSDDMQEVRNRLHILEMPRIDGIGKEYLKHKFDRAGRKLEEIFDDVGIQYILRKAKTPLAINFWVSNALEFGYRKGANRITSDMITKIMSQ